jgi:hypothetical protein
VGVTGDKLIDPFNLFAAFEKSPSWKMTGRSWPIRLRRIGKELLFESADRLTSSTPSMNVPAFQEIFREPQIFYATFF